VLSVGASALPQPPTHLDAIGQAAWQRLVAALDARGLLETELDFGMLESWAATYAQWRAAQAALNKHGLTYTLKTGYVGQRPEVAIAHKSKLLLKGLSAELGLSPSARARMSLPPPGDGADDELESLLRGDGGNL
jgi:P27 family predicted phage terminase small subunit